MDWTPIVRDLGFPIFVAVILLYDKIKTNGSLRSTVENNTRVCYENTTMIRRLEEYIKSKND